jgi:2-polyprenyl-3-methyl-5-hydroxy-6-metoxy-1,4-benzoquinol methylase
MTNFGALYHDYGTYNLLYNQLNLPSPSIEYAWRRTKIALEQELNLLSKTTPIRSVADLGCGNGALLIRLASAHPNLQFFGYDISQPFIDYANTAANYKNLSNVVFTRLDIESKNISRKFDVVISSEVLEHLPSPDLFIGKVNSLLTSGGYFLLTTPNSQNLIKYPLFFLKKMINPDSDYAHLSDREKVFKVGDQSQHLFVFNQTQLHNALSTGQFTPYKSVRSTTFFGNSFLDNHPFFFCLTILFDLFLNLINSTQIGWDHIIFSKKND